MITPWHDTEQSYTEALRTIRARGKIVMESEAWAWALYLLRRVIPDVSYCEIDGRSLAIVGERGWLEAEAGRIAAARARRVTREDWARLVDDGVGVVCGEALDG